MKTILTLVLALIVVIPAISQNLAADCDGTTVLTATAGDAVDGAAGLTLGGWVYPRDTVGGWPNFDGIFGFRDNFDFDFYILQLNGTDVEARFRNSVGTNYDLVSSSLVTNQWQHIALTYDGAELAFYYNGVLESTLPATGLIQSLGDEFYMGNLPFGITQFRLDGLVDNVQVWSRALSATEISDLHCREDLDGASYPNLAMHYRLNDGTGATLAVDAIGGYDATVSAGVTWPTTGATSCDVTTCTTANAPTNPAHTDGPSSALLTWDPVDESVACQVRGTRLTPPGPSPTVNIIGAEVGSVTVPYIAAGLGTTWEWSVRCACTISPIDATGFSVTDTFSVPILRQINPNGQASIYPNPAIVRTVLELPQAAIVDLQVSLFDLMGRSVLYTVVPAGVTAFELNLTDLPAGHYFIEVDGQRALPLEVNR